MCGAARFCRQAPHIKTNPQADGADMIIAERQPKNQGGRRDYFKTITLS